MYSRACLRQVRNVTDEIEVAECEGDGNSRKEKASGIAFEIALDDKYREEYEYLINLLEISLDG